MGKWNYDTILLEALKYQTRLEFVKGSSGAYYYAKRSGYLESICSHMEGTTIWTYELVREVALKYNKRFDFWRENASAGEYARRNGFLEFICSHMTQGATGFDKSKPAWLYYIRFDIPNEDPLYKIGITNFEDITIRIKSMGVGQTISFTLLHTWYDVLGENMYELEQLLHKKYKNTKYQGVPILNNGNTELFVIDILNLDKIK